MIRTVLALALVAAVFCHAFRAGHPLRAGSAAEDPPARPQAMTFRMDDLGKVPAGWESAHTGTGGGGVWKVETDATTPDKSGLALAQTGQSPGAVFNLCLADAPRLLNLELAVALKPVAGEKDQGGGLVWRCRDANNYYITRYNPLEENFRLYKVVDGKRIQLATQEGVKAVEGWRTIQIKHTGSAIECDLDGKKMLTAKDDTLPTAGRVGLWTKADAQTRFAALAYRRVKE